MHVIGTAGHVDHGKSALVRRLTGIDPDRFAEEKRRGLTIDLGFAWLVLPSGRELGIIDVPGHERFIKNMLAGAGGISVCLFVVAASEGWMPQSAEHLAVLEVLGVSSGVVALTKADAVDSETLELAVADVEDHLQHSTLENAPIVTCSAVTGQGLDELVTALDEVVAATPPAPDESRPRLWIDRVFTMSGAGTVVTGTLAGGSLATGDSIEISPERRRARIRTIQSHKKQVDRIAPGNRVALNLAGLDREGAARGDAVVVAGQWRPTSLVHARVDVLPDAITGREHVLTEKGAHLLYVGSAETPVRLKFLADDELVSGESGLAELRLRDALPLAHGDRFVLRDAGRVTTFGGGEILDPLPPPTRRGDAHRIGLLRQLSDSSPHEALAALVAAEGSVAAADAFLRAGTSQPPAGAVELGDLIVSSAWLESTAAEVRRFLASYHDSHPLERGATRESVRAHLELQVAPFDALLSTLPDVAEEGPLVRLASFSVQLARDQLAERAAVLGKIEAGGFTPPLAKELGVDGTLLRALTEGGDITKIGDFFLTAAQAQEARTRVRQKIESDGPITVADIRNLLSTSRKYAVPLCEWLDSTGATRRMGDVRILGPTP
jgi:selenocysteine-specific elongation factor